MNIILCRHDKNKNKNKNAKQIYKNSITILYLMMIIMVKNIEKKLKIVSIVEIII